MTYPDPCAQFGIDPGQYGIETPQGVQFLGMLLTSHTEWRTVIEFGTYIGLTSLFMGLLLQQTGRNLVTLDKSDGRSVDVQRSWLPNMQQCLMDVLEKPRNPGIEAMILSSAPCLVVMDNGNKIQEVNAYAPIIPVGSAFCVHDFGTTSKLPMPTGEIDYEDIRNVVDTYHYAPVMQQEAESIGTMFRCWVRS